MENGTIAFFIQTHTHTRCMYWCCRSKSNEMKVYSKRVKVDTWKEQKETKQKWNKLIENYCLFKLVPLLFNDYVVRESYNSHFLFSFFKDLPSVFGFGDDIHYFNCVRFFRNRMNSNGIGIVLPFETFNRVAFGFENSK